MLESKLKAGRLLAGLTQEKVVSRLAAQGLSLTKAGLSKYEKGKSTPKAGLLIALSAIYSVPSNWFFQTGTLEIEWLAFRRQAAMGKRMEERVKAYALNHAESHAELDDLLNPGVQIRLPRRVKPDSMQDIEKAARGLRTLWGLGEQPILGVIDTVEARGGMVIEIPFTLNGFDGLSGRLDSGSPVIVIGGDFPTDRRRFSVAHELGHLMLDCEGIEDKRCEQAANKFAGAFLVPAKAAREELGEKRRKLSIQELGLLKQRWGLSMQGWIYRAFDLDIISYGESERLFSLFSSLGWRKKEPVDFEAEEKPTRFRRMLHRALAEGLITPSRAEEILPGVTEMDAQRAAAKTYPTAAELLTWNQNERDSYLREVAQGLEMDYKDGGELRDFEAFAEEDIPD